METHELVGYAVLDALRTARHTYVEYGTGERELYDLAADPYQTREHRQAPPTRRWSRRWPRAWRSSRTVRRTLAGCSRICQWSPNPTPVAEHGTPVKG